MTTIVIFLKQNFIALKVGKHDAVWKSVRTLRATNQVLCNEWWYVFFFLLLLIATSYDKSHSHMDHETASYTLPRIQMEGLR